MSNRPISAEFPFDSRYLDVLGSQIHYIDEGEGEPVLFLHGSPMCNYLWRNVIPHITGNARCIAPDLIGMGKSGKPKIRYGFEDSYRYLDAFIKQMGLKNITLVVHDWGSGLGFHYARLHPDNVKGIAFMASLHDAPPLAELPLPVRLSSALLRNPFFGKLMAGPFNPFTKKAVPSLLHRQLAL